MVSEQAEYEENGKKEREEVALDNAEIHDQEEKCQIQAYTRVTILTMTGKGKKTLQDTNQNPKLEE